MSKLSDIQIICEFCDKAPGLDKQGVERIKALFNEIIGADYAHSRSKFGPHCPYFDHLEESDCTCGLSRVNDEKAELRKAVEEL